jgi:HSP20 family protein
MLLSDAKYHDVSTYPGEHIPDLDKFKTLRAQLSKTHEGAKKPDCNICETPEYYKIEVAAPGLQREDFFVKVTGRGHLSISALHTKNSDTKNEKYKEHTFNYECFHRDISLPENVDTDFLKSEYRKGILHFWFLKTEKTYQKRATTIAVY